MFSATQKQVVRFLLTVCVLVKIASCAGITDDGQGRRLLVLLDNYGIRDTHSTFFRSLKERGFQTTYKVADDSDLALSKYGEYLFDHVLLFCPNVVEFGGNVTTKSIIDFIDEGGNVLVAASSQLTEPVKEIAGECGIEFSDEDTYVIDRFNTDTNDDGQNTLIVSSADNLINNQVITGQSKAAGVPLLYRGIGMTIEAENPLLLDILKGSPTSYSYKPDEKITEYPHSVGRETVLISGLQARNNARVVFVGSLEFFSNEFFESSVQVSDGKSKFYAKSGNEALSVALTQWCFKEKGVLRIVSVTHHLQGDKSVPSAYTINQMVDFSIRIEEAVNGKWEAYTGSDVQLEFVRLDPFVRITLKNSKGNFNTQFKLPDVYGVFKFVVDYNRVGYTHTFSSTQVSVRPLEHTQYARFIPAAYPYYVSIFSMIIGVFLFSFIQLYHSDEKPTVVSQLKKTD